ncbi:hypothetical protein ACQP0C_17650 [Nocardia sp. CA-129566]|uniref:hypothetical protein n=1 Tax=Nocardia sp. CA-129566 TaxID=3239976 RepID=UPI003D984C6C
MRARLEVLVCVCAGFATLLDSSVLGITVPALRAALRADAGQFQWLLASYSLTFGLVAPSALGPGRLSAAGS